MAVPNNIQPTDIDLLSANSNRANLSVGCTLAPDSITVSHSQP